MKRSLAFRLTLVAAILLGAFGWAANTRALNGTDAAATAGYPFVGRVQDETISFNSHEGTGSYYTNGIVLTAAHVINSGPSLGQGFALEQHFERFQLGGTQYFALGVQDPLYNANGMLDPNDVGLMFLLNAPVAPVGGFPGLGSTNLVNGDTATVVGFTDWTGGSFASNKRSGTVTMSNAAANVTANYYTFSTPTSASFTQGGDSGGPLILNGNIIGTVQSGNAQTNTPANAAGIISTFVRVDSHTSFIQGNGENVGLGGIQATVVRMTNTAATMWSTAGSWVRTSTNVNAAPMANDVAILDPTANSDAGTVVTLDVNTASLNGLLNDTTINLHGNTLNVTGSSGALNGGVINASQAASVLNIWYSIDNEGGTMTFTNGGRATIGGSLPSFQTAIWNGANGTIAVKGGGLLSVQNADSSAVVANGSPTSVITVEGDGVNGGTLTAGIIDNYGTVAAKSGGLIALTNQFFNEVSGQLQISGVANGGGTATVSQLTSAGIVSVGSGGALIANASVTNFGSIIMTGGSLYTPNFGVGFTTNFASDPTVASLLTSTGTVTMTSGNISVTNNNQQGILDVRTGTFTMNGGNLSVDNMFVTNGAASQLFLNGGAITSRFSYVSNGSAFYVGSNAVPASLTLINSMFGSTHTFDNGLTIAVTPNSTGTVTLAANLLTVTNGPTVVGAAGAGVMTVSNGTAVLDDLVVGNTNGSQGTFYNTPTGATTINNTLNVGAQAGSTGTVVVTGGQFGTIGTNFVFGVFIGNAGVGSMIVSNGLVPLGSTVTEVGYTNGGQGFLGIAGGTVTVNSITIGSEVGATGNVFVAGGVLVATNGTMGIGIRGVGSMSVTAGQALVSSILMGNSGPSANGTLSVSGGTMSLASYMAAGDGPFTKGALWVTGGAFNAGNAQIDVGVDGLGLMTVSNGMASVGTLTVARDFLSSGNLTVAGGTLTVANWLHVADNLMSTGSVLVTGGSLSVTNGPTIIGNAGSGRLTVSNATVQTRAVTIAAQFGSSGTLTLNNGTLATTSLFNNTNGFVMGVGTIDGPMTNAGTISPGFSPGKIFVTGKLTLQPTSTVVMELGGTADTDYDHIIISNALQADGTLNVSLINSFAPADGNTFDIFGFTSASGQFAITNLPALNPGLSWDTSNLMTMGELAVVPEPSSLLLVFAGCSFGVLLFRRRSRRDT